MPARLLIPAALLLVIAAGCAERSARRPVLETRADSVAMRVYEAVGGPEAWASVPYLRFDFGAGSDSARQVHARHLWDRRSGRYRVEMPEGADSVYVALFDVDTREGDVFLNGDPVAAAERDELLQQAYRRFINDTYWLLVPTKLFDPGVHRAYVPDSSRAGMDVLTLSFGEVGLTPGDRYWLYVDRETGRLERWAFRLEHQAPDATPTMLRWTGYERMEAPGGPVTLATRKVNPGFTIFTDNLSLPSQVAEDAFTNPQPMLD